MERSGSLDALVAESGLDLDGDLQGPVPSFGIPEATGLIDDEAGEDIDNEYAASEASAASDDDDMAGTAEGAGHARTATAQPETFAIEATSSPPEPFQHSIHPHGSLFPEVPATESSTTDTAQAEEAMDSLSLLRTVGSITHIRNTQTEQSPDASTPSTSGTTTITAAVGEHDEAWQQQTKHFFILTSSGKPVYSYHGDTDSLAGLMALITALVSVVQAHGDRIQHLLAGGMAVVFMLQGPLILVATSKQGESVEVLQRQLELLYRQMLLVVTTGLERILLRNPAYDVRTLLEGVGAVLSSLVARLCADASYLLPGVQPLALSLQEQAGFSAALAEAVKSSGALYGALLVSGGRAVAVEHDTGTKGLPPLDAADLMVLDNFVACNASIRQQQGEAFCPLCLPAYNPAAFLHAYLHFLTPLDEVGVYLVLLAPSADSFHALSRAREQLEGQLHASGALHRLERALQPEGTAWTQIDKMPTTAGGGRLGCTALWHFMARFAHRRQVASAHIGAPFTDLRAQHQLAVSYGQLHSMVMDYAPGGRPNKLVWLCTEHQAMLAVLDSEVELYLVLDPLCDKATALRCAEQLRRYLASRAVQAELLLPGA